MAAETLARRLFDGGPRVAVVHEWIDAYAGSEQVFEAIARAFPAADLYALTRDPGVDLALGGRPVRTTALDRPGLRGRRALTLPLMPLAWRALGRGDYDVVVSSHHAFAHANRLVRPGGVHLAYVHTPARYVWSPEVDGRGRGALLAPARAVLRAADRRASRRVTAYAANSTTVARRIADCWGRSARVIAPPVRVQHFAAGAAGATRGGYVLGVGRWVGYKNLHRVIEAADLAGLPVTIAGRGPDRSRIEAAARAATVPVELVESPSDDVLRDLYQRAACLVFPTVEDFGLVPVEAQAAGTPVVGPAAGGLLDTVHDGVTGVLTRTADPADLARGVRATRSLDRAACREQAERFSAERFAVRLTAWVREVSAPARPLPRVAAGR